MSRKLLVGSRESKLAVKQAELVMEAIREIHPDIEPELVTMKTTGDKILDKRLDQIGGKGLFVKELDQALLLGKIDISVHSLKDLPTELPKELPLLGFLKREDPRDCLILEERRREEFSGAKNLRGIQERIEKAKQYSRETEIGDLPNQNSFLIGTSSKRRMLQLRTLCPDVRFETIRGNVQTRLRKLETEHFSGTILAVAGLKRLNMADRADYIFSTEEMVPAAGQGIIAIQGRNKEDYSFLKDICEEQTAIAAEAERAFTKALDGGCTSPMAAYARIEGENLILNGLYYEEKSDTYTTGKKQCLLVDENEQQDREENLPIRKENQNFLVQKADILKKNRAFARKLGMDLAMQLKIECSE